jgi:hypothetical protein
MLQSHKKEGQNKAISYMFIIYMEIVKLGETIPYPGHQHPRQ